MVGPIMDNTPGVTEHDMDLVYSTEEGPAYMKDISEKASNFK